MLSNLVIPVATGRLQLVICELIIQWVIAVLINFLIHFNSLFLLKSILRQNLLLILFYDRCLWYQATRQVFYRIHWFLRWGNGIIARLELRGFNVRLARLQFYLLDRLQFFRLARLKFLNSFVSYSKIIHCFCHHPMTHAPFLIRPLAKSSLLRHADGFYLSPAWSLAIYLTTIWNGIPVFIETLRVQCLKWWSALSVRFHVQVHASEPF